MTDQNATQTTDRHSVLAWMRLLRVFSRIDGCSADAMRKQGLSMARFDILNHAGTRDGKTQTELAGDLFVTKGNITQIIDGMERDGLLRRERHGRSNAICLTNKGRALRQRAVADQEARITRAFSGLTDDETAQLSQLLRKLERSFESAIQAK